MDRDVFLTRIRSAAMRADLPVVPKVGRGLPDIDSVDLVALFRARAVTVGTVVHGPVSRHGIPRVITGIASGHELGTFMAWDDLPGPGVTADLSSLGLQRIDHQLPTHEGRAEHLLDYQKVDLGITSADAGLAESGSIILRHGVWRPRLASLVSEVHIAILRAGDIFRSLAYWAETKRSLDVTNLVVVTGPSRTADIELQLTVGVHGPRHVHVILTD